jgi:hypothetical protein
VKSVAASYPPYSEFSFTNLFAWNARDLTEISRFDDGLIASLRNRDTGNGFYTLIGSGDLDSLVAELVDMSSAKSLEGLRLVPQVVVDSLRRPDDYIIEEDRDNFDYVLSTEYHAELKGSKNETRRRLIRKFLRENDAELAVERLDLTNLRVRTEVLDCISQWIRARGKDPQQGEFERAALTRVLDSCSQLDVQAVGFYIHGTMRAFSVYEYLTNDLGIVHFEKCDLSYRGLAQYVRHTVAKLFISNGTRYLNYEQDLGLRGLRQAKSMLHPDRFLKKYTIRT